MNADALRHFCSGPSRSAQARQARPAQWRAQHREGAWMKLLFICSQNRRRSLTAERIFDGVAGHQARSAGTEDGARIRVTPGHLGWADMIFVMEPRHRDRLRAKFRQGLVGKCVVCLHIADDYGYMDDDLIARLEAAVTIYLSETPASGTGDAAS